LSALNKLCWGATYSTGNDALNACQRADLSALLFIYAVMQKSSCVKNPKCEAFYF